MAAVLSDRALEVVGCSDGTNYGAVDVEGTSEGAPVGSLDAEGAEDDKGSSKTLGLALSCGLVRGLVRGRRSEAAAY